MFGNDLNLDLSKVKEQTGYDLVQPGDHLVICEQAELKYNRKGDGQFIKCMFTITEGASEGRKLFTNFNVSNVSQKAVGIGLAQLKSFIKCATNSDIQKLTNPSDLIGLSAIAVVKIKKDDNYGDTNTISYFKAKPVTTATTTTTTSKKKNPFS